MSQNLHTPSWLWGVGCGLGLGVVAVVCVLLLNANNNAPIEVPSAVIEFSDPGVDTSLLPTITPAVVEEPFKLPHLNFLPGSIEEDCGLNEFPPHWATDANLRIWEHPQAIESTVCWTALEDHMHAMNPYLWGTTDNRIRPFAVVVLENPLTFERIFADPTGDFTRMQEALSRPECLLEPNQKNWDLKKLCHADAFLNYALINRFCFDEGISTRSRTYYWGKDNPTPEQDRFMWRQDLEDDWVGAKCEELNPTLELTIDEHPVLYELVMSLREEDSRNKTSHTLLIELAARLGDDAAGLTEETVARRNHYYGGNGKKYGRFSWLLSSDDWREFANNKEPPSAARFLRMFNMLAQASGRRADPRDGIQLDWKIVAQRLCTPPYYTNKSWHDALIKDLESDERYAAELLAFREKHDNPKSCLEVVHEIRQSDLKFRPLLDALDKFEQVALELGVYN